MKRLLSALILLSALAFSASDADALVGITFKFGGAYIPNGSRPGGVIQADFGPLSPFAELYRKSGVTTANVGLNLIFFKLPLPILQPYIGAGGGISRSSGGGVSKERVMLTGLGGTDLKLTEGLHFFGQIKYLYTLGSGAFVVRDVALQAGVAFRLGI